TRDGHPERSARKRMRLSAQPRDLGFLLNLNPASCSRHQLQRQILFFDTEEAERGQTKWQSGADYRRVQRHWRGYCKSIWRRGRRGGGELSFGQGRRRARG